MLFEHILLDQLLREWELIRVLLILLLKVFKQHSFIVIIKLVQVNEHLLIVFTFIALTIVFLLLVPLGLLL